jgi:hypothetical protein
MKDPPGVAVGCTTCCSCSGCDQALGPPHLVVAPVKPYMQSVSSFSHKCSNFSERHHALDAHPINFYSALFLDFSFSLFLSEEK